MDYQQPQNIDSGKFITGSPTPTADERTWGLLAHLSPVAGSMLCGLFPLGPLIVMLTKGKESTWVNDQAKESLNFQITILVAYLISAVLSLVCIGIFTAIATGIAHIVFMVIGALKANEGVMYRYPFALRLIK